ATPGKTSSVSQVAAMPDAVPLAASVHEPTLIGERSLKTRNMLRKRSGRPRSLIRSGGLAAQASAATRVAARERLPRPAARATRARVAAPPATPPAKKYHPISGFHTGSLMIGWP